ncbi:hypothetical protein MMC30_007300 [Trapelia coarctata]|nr:hypothetical protein [Trapelia coarctata]
MSPISNSLNYLILRQVPPPPTGSGASASSSAASSNSTFVEVTVPIIGAVIILIIVGFCIRMTSVRRTAARPAPYGGSQYQLAPVAGRLTYDVQRNPMQLMSDPPEAADGIAEPPPAYTAREHGKAEGTRAATVASSGAAAAELRV